MSMTETPFSTRDYPHYTDQVMLLEHLATPMSPDPDQNKCRTNRPPGTNALQHLENAIALSECISASSHTHMYKRQEFEST